MKGSLQERQQARAAGRHPLQQSFRAAAASLLAKHGLKVDPCLPERCLAWTAPVYIAGIPAALPPALATMHGGRHAEHSHGNEALASKQRTLCMPCNHVIHDCDQTLECRQPHLAP